MTSPGRLGDPDLDFHGDPRADPRMVATLGAFGLDRIAPPPPVGVDDAREDQLAFAAEAETGFEAVFQALMADLPEVAGVLRTTESVPREDGSTIELHLSRPDRTDGPVPGVLNIHGGGMAFLSATDPLYRHWRDSLAAAGAVVVGVEFRNSAGALGPHPYPAGLDDCSAALDWMHERRSELDLSAIVVNGDSGGGNLSLATVLRAKRDGRLDRVDGAYAIVPFISGAYGRPEYPQELASMRENDDYFIGSKLLGVLATLYDPDRENVRNPLAWPLHAADEDLEGLPPHVVTTNQLDPLRDEGLEYLRRLRAAGVDASGHTIGGMCHIGELMSAKAIPTLYARTVSDVVTFARRAAEVRGAG